MKLENIGFYTLSEKVIGFCEADRIPCRPKLNMMAVMFAKNSGEEFWTHISMEVFQKLKGAKHERKDK